MGPVWLDAARPAAFIFAATMIARRGISEPHVRIRALRPFATAFGKMIVVPTNTFGSATCVMFRYQNAASRRMWGPKALIDAGGFEPTGARARHLGAAIAGAFGKRRQLALPLRKRRATDSRVVAAEEPGPADPRATVSSLTRCARPDSSRGLH